MSQYPPVDPKPIAPKPPEETNGIALAALVVSIASLILCGIPAIMGILLSLIGLRKEPRGLAVAGLIISTVALLEMFAVGLLGYGMFQAARTVKSAVQNVGTQFVLNAEANEIAREWQSNGALPDAEAGQEMVAGSRDTYGDQIVYETDGTSFSLRSRGPDGELNTEDDIVIGPFSTPEEALRFDPEILEAELEKLKESGELDPEVLQQWEESGALDSEIRKKIRQLEPSGEDSSTTGGF